MTVPHLIGESPSFQATLDEINMVAPVDCAVLIRGETGTGKEVVARAIHAASPRCQNRFVALNCAAIPSGLIESELFGHERGAFTGAVTPTLGRFQIAHRGTLFLDEIGDLPLELQPKLLRVLQERQLERLGSHQAVLIDVRIIAGTNQDLWSMVQEGTFRADLYCRLTSSSTSRRRRCPRLGSSQSGPHRGPQLAASAQVAPQYGLLKTMNFCAAT